MKKYILLGLILFFLATNVFVLAKTQGEIEYYYFTNVTSSSFCSPLTDPGTVDITLKEGVVSTIMDICSYTTTDDILTNVDCPSNDLTKYLQPSPHSGICYSYYYASNSEDFCEPFVDLNYVPYDTNSISTTFLNTRNLDLNYPDANVSGVCYSASYGSFSDTFCDVNLTENCEQVIVCGDNNVSYSSLCEVMEAGVSSYCAGSCPCEESDLISITEDTNLWGNEGTHYLLFENNFVGTCFDFNYFSYNTCEGATQCFDGDGCCPQWCTSNMDSDCEPCDANCGCELIEDCSYDNQTDCDSNGCSWYDGECFASSFDPCDGLTYEAGFYFEDENVCKNHFYIIYENEKATSYQCEGYNELDYITNESDCESNGGTWDGTQCLGYACQTGVICATGCVDRDGDTYDDCDSSDPDDDGKPIDCNDYDNTIYPGAEELCDGKDNDCDGEIDEGCYPCDPFDPCVHTSDCDTNQVCVDGCCKKTGIVCPMCTAESNDSCSIVECETNADCSTGCGCSPTGICWFEEDGDLFNSITKFDGNFPSIIFINVATKLYAENLFISLWDMNNNNIPISIPLTSLDKSSDGMVFSSSETTTYSIIPQTSLEEGQYRLIGEIPPPCDICKREIMLYTKGFNVEETVFSIPDNNLLLIVLIACVLAIILPRKRIYS